jgi:hypothetical protein
MTVMSQSGQSRPAARESDSQNCLLIVAAYADAPAVGPGAAEAGDRIMMSPALGDFIVTRFVPLGEPPAPPSRPDGYAAAVGRIADEFTAPNNATGKYYFGLVIADPSAAMVTGLIAACRANPMLAQLPLRCHGLAEIEDRDPGGAERGGPDRADVVSIALDGRVPGHDLADELVAYAEHLLRDFATTSEPGLSAGDLTLIRRQPAEPTARPASTGTPRALEPPAPEPPGLEAAALDTPRAGPAPGSGLEEDPRRPVPAETTAATSGLAGPARLPAAGTADPGAPALDRNQAGGRAWPGSAGLAAAAPPDPARTGRSWLPAIPRRLPAAPLRRISRWAGALRPQGSAGTAGPVIGAAGGAGPASGAIPTTAVVFLVLTCLDSPEARASWSRGRALVLEIDKKLAGVPSISYWVRALQGTVDAPASTCQPAGQLARGSLRHRAAHDDFGHTLAEVRRFVHRDQQAVTPSAGAIARPGVVIVALDAPVADASTARCYDELRQECTVVWIALGHGLRLLSPVFQEGGLAPLSDAPDIAVDVVSLLNSYAATAAQVAAEAAAPAAGSPPHTPEL